jgi:hypothetical protein
MIVSITTFTLIHTLISLVAIGFPFTKLLPSHDVGILSLVVLVPVILARYRKHMEGAAVPAQPAHRDGTVRLAGVCRLQAISSHSSGIGKGQGSTCRGS